MAFQKVKAPKTKNTQSSKNDSYKVVQSSIKETQAIPKRQNTKLEETSKFAYDFSKIPVYGSHTPVTVQAKLTIGQPGDKYEQEADSVARQVVRKINSPQSETIQRELLPQEEEEMLSMKAISPSIQRQKEPEEEELMRKPIARNVTDKTSVFPDLEASIQQAQGGGKGLSESIRKPMEQAFGFDFSQVKIHTDAKSNQLNQSIQAKAFTTGQNIFFRQGEYNPDSLSGQELIAHELTHVTQQNAAIRLKPAESLNLNFLGLKNFIHQKNKLQVLAKSQPKQDVLQLKPIPSKKAELTKLRTKIKEHWQLEDEDANEFIEWCNTSGNKATEMIDKVFEVYAKYSDWQGEAKNFTSKELLDGGALKDSDLRGTIEYKLLMKQGGSSESSVKTEDTQTDFDKRAKEYVDKNELPEYLLEEVQKHIVPGYFTPDSKTGIYFRQLLSEQSIIEASRKDSKLLKKWKGKHDEATKKIDEILQEIKLEANTYKQKQARDKTIDDVAALAKPNLDSATNGTDPLVQEIWEASVQAGKANGYIKLNSGPYTSQQINRAVLAWRNFKDKWQGNSQYSHKNGVLDNQHVPGGANFIGDKSKKTNVEGADRKWQTDFIAKWMGTNIVVHVDAVAPSTNPPQAPYTV